MLKYLITNCSCEGWLYTNKYTLALVKHLPLTEMAELPKKTQLLYSRLNFVDFQGITLCHEDATSCLDGVKFRIE